MKQKEKPKPKQKGPQTNHAKICNRLYEDHKDRQIRMQQRKKEKEREERKPWEKTKSRIRNRMRKERQIKEEDTKFTDEIVKIGKEGKKLRETKEKIRSNHQGRIKRSNSNIGDFKEESSNVEINNRKPSQKDKLKLTNRQQNKNRKISIKPKTKTKYSTHVNITQTFITETTTTTPLKPNPASKIIRINQSTHPNIPHRPFQNRSPIKQEEIQQEFSTSPLQKQAFTNHNKRKDSLIIKFSSQEEAKSPARNKNVRRQADKRKELRGSNQPQTPVSHETLQHNQKLKNKVLPQPQTTSSLKPKKTAKPSFKPLYKRVYPADRSRFLTQASKPPIPNSNRGIYKREIRKEETNQKEVTKETGIVNKLFLMKGKERAMSLNSAQRSDERLLPHDCVTKLEKILECSTGEIKNIGSQQDGKIEKNSNISNITSSKSGFELREKSRLNTLKNVSEESDKTGHHLLKDKPTSITSSQSTQEETKEDSPFPQKKTPQKSINKELPKIESPPITTKTEEKQEEAFLIPSKGLRNPSQDCFSNASLQCLISASSFIKSFLSQNNLNDSLEEIEEEPTVTAKFRDFINTYFNPSDDVVNAQEFRACFIDDFPKRRQHDAIQYILSLFQKLQEEHNKNAPVFKSSGHRSSQAAWENYQKDHTSIIDQLFVGMNQNSFKCQECNYGPIIYEEFKNIPVCFEEGQKRYQVNIENIRSTTESSEFFCKKCKATTSCIIENTIVKFPQYLLLSFQRLGIANMAKIDELMKYEKEFSIKTDDKSTKNYSLISIICHQGSIRSGHYTAYCKRGDTWKHFNDSYVTETCYPDSEKNAYILLYEAK